MKKIGILGATGYTGEELLRYLSPFSAPQDIPEKSCCATCRAIRTSNWLLPPPNTMPAKHCATSIPGWAGSGTAI